jgi:glycosyltransferase involved in cell wall biosynthesis
MASVAPLLSIVVPAFNVGPYIRECVESLGEASSSDCELIVVNDGSTDDTPAVLDDLAAWAPWLKIIHTENQGLASARSRGLAAATGEYVWFVDSDDRIRPGAIGVIRQILEAKQPDILQFDFERFYADGVRRPSQRCCSAPPGRLLDARVVGLSTLFKDRLFYMWLRVFRRNLFRNASLRHVEQRYFEDIINTPYLFARARSFCFLDQVLLNYRQRDGSIIYSISSRTVTGMWTAVSASRQLLMEENALQYCDRSFTGFLAHVFLSTSRDSVKRVADRNPVELLGYVRQELNRIIAGNRWTFFREALATYKPEQLLNFLIYYFLPLRLLAHVKRPRGGVQQSRPSSG